MLFLLQLYWPGFKELSELSEEDGVSQTKSKKISHIPHVVSMHRLQGLACAIPVQRHIHSEVFNVQLGERLKLAWLGVEADPLLQSDDLLKKAYNRLSQDVNGSTQKSPKRLISKNAIVSGLGLLGIKQGNVDSVEGEARASKVRRKRIVRKKVPHKFLGS